MYFFNEQIMKKLFFIGAFFILIGKTNVVYASDSSKNLTYKVLTQEYNISSDKEWTIKFNHKLNASTVSDSNVYIVDDLGNRVDINIACNGNSINIKPKNPYKDGCTYCIIINDQVKSSKGNKIEEPIKKYFTIHKEKCLTGKTIVLDAGHNFGGDDGAYGNGYSERDLNMQVVSKLKDKLEKKGANIILTRKPEDRETIDLSSSLIKRGDIANKANADLFISIHHDSSSAPSAHGTSAFYGSYRTNLDKKDVYVNIQDSDVPVRKGYYGAPIIGTVQYGENYKYIRETDDGGFIIDFKGTEVWVSNEYCRAYDPTPTKEAAISKAFAQNISNEISSLGIANRGVTDRNLYVVRRTNMPSVLIEIGFVTNFDEVKKISQPNFQEKIADKIVDAIIKTWKLQ